MRKTDVRKGPQGALKSTLSSYKSCFFAVKFQLFAVRLRVHPSRCVLVSPHSGDPPVRHFPPVESKPKAHSNPPSAHVGHRQFGPPTEGGAGCSGVQLKQHKNGCKSGQDEGTAEHRHQRRQSGGKPGLTQRFLRAGICLVLDHGNAGGFSLHLVLVQARSGH